ncbi:MAG: 3'(2'),5'-bisphosphate nucleotidase [Beggiatoa sp. IS2]|nr:MAG: 3'(2'),5'-bisphosphate nucleotidase [Beggiatoa sp. IS2]
MQPIAQTAGEHIMEVYVTDFGVEHKDDKSPLTLADKVAHEVIVSSLNDLTPDLPVLSEESASIPFAQRQHWQRYWLVDPLDGTREFIKRNGEFTVNIALIDNHQSVLGIVYVPVTGVTYYAAVGHGAFKRLPEAHTPQPIKVRPCLPHQITIAGSRSHSNKELETFVERMAVDVKVELKSIGSSLKTCLVAEGQADIYPRFGLTSEWDTAAAQCVIEQAGGHLTDLQWQPLRYNTKDSLLNPHFIVFGDNRKNWARYL